MSKRKNEILSNTTIIQDTVNGNDKFREINQNLYKNNNNNNTIIHNQNKNNLEDFIDELKQRNNEQDFGQDFMDEEDSEIMDTITATNNHNDIINFANHHQLYSQHEDDHHHNHDVDDHPSSRIDTLTSSLQLHQQQQQQSPDIGSGSPLLAILAKKEKDLILAAELGKALLDRNEELSRTNEQLNEEYTKNIELLEQEKYALRKKLNSIEIEYENKIHDLQVDLRTINENMNAHLEISKQNETETNRIIDELTEQNRRLTIELKESSNRESSLEKEIQSLKEQFSARRTNFSDHIGQLEGLRDEINLLSNRKRDLETKISSLNEEKETMTITLDETQFKILSLEKQLFEKESHISNQQKELEDLRRMNIHYQNKLDYFVKMKSFDVGMQQVSSLYNEIEVSSQSSCEEIDMFNTDNGAYCHRCLKTKHEMGDLYNKLRQIFDDLNRHRQSDTTMEQLNNHVSSSSNSNHDSGIQTNLSLTEELNVIVCDLQDLIKNLDFMQCLSCQQFSLERNELNRLRKKTQQDKEEILRLNQELMKFTSDYTIQQAELKAMMERNKILEDDAKNLAELNQDEIVKRALTMRDETISRKNVVEIELAKIRIELMHVNSQLLETIQQKVELSQQLEQWQVDMEILIEEQLKNKLNTENKKTFPNAPNGTTNAARKDNLFGLINFSKLLNYQRSS